MRVTGNGITRQKLRLSGFSPEFVAIRVRASGAGPKASSSRSGLKSTSLSISPGESLLFIDELHGSNPMQLSSFCRVIPTGNGKRGTHEGAVCAKHAHTEVAVRTVQTGGRR